jgi:thioesterase domain-containing protein
MKAVQATEPYFLVGHSFEGLVVFEIAQRLLETGERVACSIMFDSPVFPSTLTKTDPAVPTFSDPSLAQIKRVGCRDHPFVRPPAERSLRPDPAAVARRAVKAGHRA